MAKKVVVVGGGPAGLSCALWLQQLDLNPIVIEQSQKLGGLQTMNPFINRWYLGTIGQTGQALAQQFHDHIKTLNVPIRFNSTVKRLTAGDPFHLWTETEEIEAHALVIATGQHYNCFPLVESIEGSAQLLTSDRVCFSPGNPHTLGRIVAVVGGGDNGVTQALMLAKDQAIEHIHLLVRSQLRGYVCFQETLHQLAQAGRLTLHQPAILRRFNIQDDLITITYTPGSHPDEDVRELCVDYLYFRLGFTPNSRDLAQVLADGGLGSLQVNAAGYITTDPFTRTSIPRVYAIGDVANQRDPCVATAVAQGTIAARSIDQDLRV